MKNTARLPPVLNFPALILGAGAAGQLTAQVWHMRLYDAWLYNMVVFLGAIPASAAGLLLLVRYRREIWRDPAVPVAAVLSGCVMLYIASIPMTLGGYDFFTARNYEPWKIYTYVTAALFLFDLRVFSISSCLYHAMYAVLRPRATTSLDVESMQREAPFIPAAPNTAQLAKMTPPPQKKIPPHPEAFLKGKIFPPAVLRDCFRAFVKTVPNREHLEAHIRRLGLEPRRDEIVAELTALLDLADDHLYDYPGGVPWTPNFITAYRALLVKQHPWIDAPTFQTIQAHAQWLCWHDGLNAPDAV